MKVTIDSGGRLLLPKSLRDSTGLLPGTQVDVSVYVAVSDTVVTDDVLFALIDAGRR